MTLSSLFRVISLFAGIFKNRENRPLFLIPSQEEISLKLMLHIL